jgi:hypothetical protein
MRPNVRPIDGQLLLVDVVLQEGELRAACRFFGQVALCANVSCCPNENECCHIP